MTVFCSAFQYLKDLEIENENECEQREKEAIRCLSDKILESQELVKQGTFVELAVAKPSC